MFSWFRESKICFLPTIKDGCTKAVMMAGTVRRSRGIKGQRNRRVLGNSIWWGHNDTSKLVLSIRINLSVFPAFFH